MFLKRLFVKKDNQNTKGRSSTVIGAAEIVSETKNRSSTFLNEKPRNSVTLGKETKQEKFEKYRKSTAIAGTFNYPEQIAEESKQKVRKSIFMKMGLNFEKSKTSGSSNFNEKVDFQIGGVTSNLSNFSKKIENFSEDFSNLNQQETFDERRKFREESFNKIQMKNLEHKVNCDFSEGYLYASGLSFHSYLSSGSKNFCFELKLKNTW
jgi:hypothetical protein